MYPNLSFDPLSLFSHSPFESRKLYGDVKSEYLNRIITIKIITKTIAKIGEKEK